MLTGTGDVPRPDLLEPFDDPVPGLAPVARMAAAASRSARAYESGVVRPAPGIQAGTRSDPQPISWYCWPTITRAAVIQ
jgi:hypothetical protein